MIEQQFVILGGGTAAWMSALLCQKALKNTVITVVESPHMGTIGVGEGSTPALKGFMDALGISECEWMPKCHATYKSGISFSGWSTQKGFEEYFHPFYSHFDRDHIKALIYNAQLRRSGVRVHAHPNAFSYSSYLASAALCPVTPYSFPFEVQYGYHFNAGLLGQYLKEVAIARGVKWKSAHISDVVRSGEGEISHLISEDNEKIEGDFFIDCSGFSARLSGKALKTPYISYEHILLNDRAVTLALPGEESPKTQTVSVSMKYGWRWRIPLQNRIGNGYVYSSKFCNEDAAEKELREHLNLGDSEGEAQHLKMRVGRLDKMWSHNCLAVGLSQGFIEPLEATALALVQLTISRFVRYYQAGKSSNEFQHTLNTEISEAFDSVKDYVHLHYLTSNRTDTNYWRAHRENSDGISDRLQKIINVWFGGGDLVAALNETGLDRHYKSNSWVYMLSGMGMFPPEEKLKLADPRDEKKVPMHAITDFFERCTLNHLSQKEVLIKMNNNELPYGNSPPTPLSEEAAFNRLLGAEFANYR